MFAKMPDPVSARQLYAQFAACPMPAGRVLALTGAGDCDVYNPSIPFTLCGKTVIAGRVERRDSEDATTMLFERQPDGAYRLLAGAPTFPGMQDPFVATIQGDTILGGIHALWRPDGSLITYHADFYRLHGMDKPEFLFQGPEYMKDIRLLDLEDGRVAVFSRPQGAAVQRHGRKAAIGFAIADSLSEIDADFIANAPLMQWHFLPEEWGGPNQLYLLRNGLIGMIGHIAWSHAENGQDFLHYYSFAQAIDPATRGASPMKLIGCRACYGDAPAKAPRLRDVCFTSGIVRKPGGKATLYSGLSDARCGCMEIDDPFAEYERL